MTSTSLTPDGTVSLWKKPHTYIISLQPDEQVKQQQQQYFKFTFPYYIKLKYLCMASHNNVNLSMEIQFSLMALDIYPAQEESISTNVLRPSLF